MHEPIAKDDIDRLKEEILKTDFMNLVESAPDSLPASASGVRTFEEDKASVTEHEMFLLEDDHHEGRFNKKPIGKLTKLIMSQPFAQNWFFKSAEQVESPNHILENFHQKEEWQESTRKHRELLFIAPQHD